jgi:hypothetical protein
MISTSNTFSPPNLVFSRKGPADTVPGGKPDRLPGKHGFHATGPAPYCNGKAAPGRIRSLHDSNSGTTRLNLTKLANAQWSHAARAAPATIRMSTTIIGQISRSCTR